MTTRLAAAPGEITPGSALDVALQRGLAHGYSHSKPPLAISLATSSGGFARPWPLVSRTASKFPLRIASNQGARRAPRAVSRATASQGRSLIDEVADALRCGICSSIETPAKVTGVSVPTAWSRYRETHHLRWETRGCDIRMPRPPLSCNEYRLINYKL